MIGVESWCLFRALKNITLQKSEFVSDAYEKSEEVLDPAITLWIKTYEQSLLLSIGMLIKNEEAPAEKYKEADYKYNKRKIM